MSVPPNSNDRCHVADCIRLACQLEATARKPGNVHPAASFDDMTYHDFLTSARAIAPVLSQAEATGVGRAVLTCVEQTKAAGCRNTNLGIILLLAPLATVPDDVSIVEGIDNVLERLTRADAEAVYSAIRLAQPGGLGTVDQEDVAETPSVTLLEAMRLAAGHDTIAAQYANSFHHVLNVALPSLLARNDFQKNWEEAVIELHLRLMSEIPDTLIARKCGLKVADESARRAKKVLDAGWPKTEAGSSALVDFDDWLRGDGHRRNPGTTADLIAATLFAGFRDRILPRPSLENFSGSQFGSAEY